MKIKKCIKWNTVSATKTNKHCNISWGSGEAQRIFPRFAPMSPWFDSQSRHLCALGLQSKLAFAGFSLSTPVFLPHPKLDQKDLKSDQRALLESSGTH